MSEAVDVVVIGAGVVGLSIARALALSGREVVVLEKNDAVGAETSSRNSEVVHAGIYYPPGSRKAHWCVGGRERLYRYCDDKGVAFRRCGKLIVAVTDTQVSGLDALQRTAAANGVADLERLSGAELHRLEPAVRGAGALLSPSTGIVDSHGLMLALQGDLERAGGHVALRAELTEGHYAGDRIRLSVAGDDGSSLDLSASVVVNAGGLHAVRIAHAIGGIAERAIPRMFYAKGNYFAYRGQSPFGHLVYPLPEVGGLGIHATLDLAGRTRFGPDVEWCDEPDYSLDPSRVTHFYTAIRRYYPALQDGTLTPAYVGVRPKISGPSEPAADFMLEIARPGAATLIELFGVESPGLTSSLAIGDYVVEQLAA